MQLHGYGLAAFPGFLAFLWLALVGLVHVVFAVGVHRDAHELRRGPDLAPAGVWVLATLLVGVPVAAIYWALHRSTLRPGSVRETGAAPETHP